MLSFENAAICMQGYKAQQDGLGFLDNPYNPYDPSTDAGRHWIHGLVESIKDEREAGFD